MTVETLPTISESALFAAYRARPRTERCVCGGWPLDVQDRDDQHEIQAAIDVHNRSTLHALWRSRQENA